jgi:hypothetical protein
VADELGLYTLDILGMIINLRRDFHPRCFLVGPQRLLGSW